VLYNNGSGVLTMAPAALPEVSYLTRALGLADLNGDGTVDLLLGASGAPLKFYANRGDGRLEDRSFLTLPAGDALDPTAVAVGPWDADCLPDALVARAGGGAPVVLRGASDGTLVDDGAAGATGDLALLIDLDGDGDRDLVMRDGAEVVWAAR